MGTLNFLSDYSLNIVVNGILVILLLSLHLALALDDFWNKKKVYSYFRFFIYVVIVFIVLDLVVSFGVQYFWSEKIMDILYIAYYLVGESLYVGALLLLYAFVEERKAIEVKEKKVSLTAMTAVNILGTIVVSVQVLNTIGLGYINGITEICLIINNLINMIIFGYALIKYRKAITKSEFLSILICSAVVIITSCIDVVSGIFINIVLAAFVVVIYMQILNGRKANYMKEHEELMKKNAELAEANNSIMVSQIQPHFLYNTLNSIASLCKIDPDMAQKVTIDFAKYLRVNMDSLNKKEPVSFSDEMEHVKTYLEIEKIRFGDHLNVDFDIETEEFKIPSLTLQPIVENAVKHGICKKEEPGTLKVITRKSGTGYTIIIEDDGVGFDKNQPLDESRKHVGIENVRTRLRMQSYGTLKIDSIPGVGTRAVIFIPKAIY